MWARLSLAAENWAATSERPGYLDPFALTPDHVYAVMGALKQAGYRSAQQYLDVATHYHVASGLPWTDQLQLSYRISVRSCKRGLGPSKHASALPLGLPLSYPNGARAFAGHSARATRDNTSEMPPWLHLAHWLLRVASGSPANRPAPS